MSKPIKHKTKTVTIEDLKVTYRSLTLDELGLVFNEMKTKGPFQGAKVALEYGIVSPAILKDNIGKINAEHGILLATKILKLTGCVFTPEFNPSER